MNSLPTTPFPVDQLGGSPDAWSGVINSFNHLVVEIDNRSARAVKMFPKLAPSSRDGELCDEEGGFHVDLTAVSRYYALAKNASNAPDARVELDFPELPGLVRLWDVFQKGESNLASIMASLFSEQQLSLEALDARRGSESPSLPLCPCCEERARERARYTSMHPLFDILMQATRETDVLQVRVMSPYADLSVPLLPYRVEANNGILTAIDKEHTSALHLDVRWLHAMSIKQVKLDGTTYTVLLGYDSFGTEIFHLASPRATAIDDWMQCCEWSKPFFSK